MGWRILFIFLYIPTVSVGMVVHCELLKPGGKELQQVLPQNRALSLSPGLPRAIGTEDATERVSFRGSALIPGVFLSGKAE